jgi:ubiquinone/menaquinone biosynthesis C-methylase UbiE
MLAGMDARHPTYAPGWGTEVVSMVSSRTAEDRAGFLLPLLSGGMRVLDVGCGPGSITCGLARAIAPGGHVVGVDVQPSQIELAKKAAGSKGNLDVTFQAGNASALPFEGACFDVVFAHALFEHLADPPRVLAEMARLLRPRGLLAVCSSDWSGARVEPCTPDVQRALAAHFALRRRAGGDPFAGSRLVEWVTAAGFSIESTGTEEKVDMRYADLASYVGGRIREALSLASESDPELEEALAAAVRWAEGRSEGRAVQRWVHVVARRA